MTPREVLLHIVFTATASNIIAGQPWQMITIDMLPGDVLFEIFDLYRLDALEHSPLGGRFWEWYTLAQVCQRWRSVLLESSRYFGLKVFCTYGTPSREILSSSLDFPVIARYGGFPESNLLTAEDEDGVITLLDHPARLFEVQLTATAPILEKLATLEPTQQPFSMLEHLRLSTRTKPGLILPSEFGGTPGLRNLWVIRIALPSLPRLMLLAPNLVSLRLEEIPDIGYTLEALLICLPGMTQLKTLRIHFLFPSSRPVLVSTLHSSERRSVLHGLHYMEFHGPSEYLEYLVSTITTPSLKHIHIAFFNQLIFHIPQVPQLSQFILRTETQRSANQATIHYSEVDISITLSQPGSPHYLALRILCKNLDWQISSITELCEGLSHNLLHIEQLNICASPTSFEREEDEMELTQLEFPDLFRQFINVRRLCVMGGSVSHVAGALGHITGQLADMVLPELRVIYVEKDDELTSMQRGLQPFLVARWRSGHPVFIRSLEGALRPEPNQSSETHGYFTITLPTGIYHIKDYYTLIPEGEDQNPQILEVEDQNPQIMEVEDLNIPEHFRGNPHLLEILDLVGSSLQAHLDMHPSQEAEVNLLRRLVYLPAFGSQIPETSVQAISILELLVWNGMAAEFERLLSMKRAKEISSVAGFTTPLLYNFGRLRSRLLHIPLEHSPWFPPYLIECGELESAVETIEQRRDWDWHRLSECSPIGRLWSINPDLARRLAYFNQALEAVNIQISTSQDDADTFNAALEELEILARENQEVIQEIRALEGFADFMETIPFPTLQSAAARGPIIIINHCRWRCDIIIVLHNSPPSLILTEEGFYDRAKNLANQLKESRQQYGLDSQDYNDVLADVLAELYELVGQPVIDRLRQLDVPEKCRVWWYPTSVFWSLPLHAMGPVPSDDGRLRYFLDLYICSYTPTLRALIQSRKSHTPKLVSQHSMLLVAPSDDIPGARKEVLGIENLEIPTTTLLSSNATKAAVIENLQNHTLAHFIGHGTLEPGEPLDAATRLYDDDRLTLRDIINLPLLPTELGFLSLCHSAESTEVDNPTTEGLNIAAAMQYRGCGSVVGVMWALADTDGVYIARHFYKALLARRRENIGVPLGERSAEALWSAVKNLRKKRKVVLERWVNWVHYGA